MKKAIVKILNVIVFIFTGKGEMADEAVNDEILDYSGQGRDKYGK